MADDFDAEAYLDAKLQNGSRSERSDPKPKRRYEEEEDPRSSKRRDEGSERSDRSDRRFTEDKRDDRRFTEDSRRSKIRGDSRGYSPRRRSASRSPRRRSRSPARSPRRFNPPPPRRYDDDRRSGRYDRFPRRDKRDFDDKKEDAAKDNLTDAERELMEIERAQRSVFVYHLSVKTDEDKLKHFFDIAGKVKDVRLITDRNTRRSKGFGYIEFADKESVPKALLLAGQILDGQPVLVKSSEAEKNFAANARTSIPVNTNVGPTRLYVGSLHFNVTEDDLKTVFNPFGELEFIQLQNDPETGRSKGFGFVQYRSAESAKKALMALNGIEIAGRPMKVGLVNETKTDVGGGSLGELDDDGGGLQLNAQSRALLMAKLQRGAMGTSPLPMPVTSFPSASMMSGMTLPLSSMFGTPSPAPQVAMTPPSPCVLLKNMFDQSPHDDEFYEDIQEDVGEECRKFGPVKHLRVERGTAGHVWVKFASIDGAQKALSTLNHRWFAGKMISVEYVPEASYRVKFPEAK